MTDATRSALGLSVGATQLTAVTADNAVCRTPVLTLFEHRPPEVGLPSERQSDHASEARGLVIGDFVDRVGDPVAILATDGTPHRSEMLLADALRALSYAATRGRRLPDATAVSYPAHWRPAAVEALRRALSQVPEWAREPVTMLPDVTAALTALQSNPGLPTRGVIALCDLGGTGTNVALIDAAGGNRPIGPVVRHSDFSGDLIDQALLTHVIGDLAGAGSVDLASTSAIGSLTRLRAQCRAAKERLSASAVTAMPVELPGYRGDVRITRTELDDVVRAPLQDVVDLVEDTMQRNGIRPGDLVAVATVGGGAGMAAVTTALSDHFRVPVITTPRPAISAAIGVALRALRGPVDESATALAPAAPAVQAAPVAPAAKAERRPDPVPAPRQAALAWSQADDRDLPDLELPPAEPANPRPRIEFEEEPAVVVVEERPAVPWYRTSVAVMAAAVIVIAGAVSTIGVLLADDSMTTPATTQIPSVTATPVAPPAAAAQPPAAPQPAPQDQDSAPAPMVKTVVPAPETQTQIVQQAAPQPPAPEAPVVTEQAPPPEAPAPEAPAPAVPQWVPRIPPIPQIPGLPQIFQPPLP
jgi:Hsp70 protein